MQVPARLLMSGGLEPLTNRNLEWNRFMFLVLHLRVGLVLVGPFMPVSSGTRRLLPAEFGPLCSLPVPVVRVPVVLVLLTLVVAGPAIIMFPVVPMTIRLLPVRPLVLVVEIMVMTL